MTKKQDVARRKNFNIMVLRGMYTQLQRIKYEHPDLNLYIGDTQLDIDICLERLQVESQTVRIEREKRIEKRKKR